MTLSAVYTSIDEACKDTVSQIFEISQKSNLFFTPTSDKIFNLQIRREKAVSKDVSSLIVILLVMLANISTIFLMQERQTSLTFLLLLTLLCLLFFAFVLGKRLIRKEISISQPADQHSNRRFLSPSCESANHSKFQYFYSEH